MSRYGLLAFLSACALLACSLGVVESRPADTDEDYSDYKDEEVAVISTTTTPRPTTVPHKPHFVKYRVPGQGGCWRRNFEGPFRFVRTRCFLCPRGSVIGGGGDCWKRGIDFRMLN